MCGSGRPARLLLTLPVWSGHSCPLPLTLTLILSLISRSPSRCLRGRHDREGHDVQSCRKADTTCKERRLHPRVRKRLWVAQRLSAAINDHFPLNLVEPFTAANYGENGESLPKGTCCSHEPATTR